MKQLKRWIFDNFRKLPVNGGAP